jgi:hypothetical protein
MPLVPASKVPRPSGLGAIIATIMPTMNFFVVGECFVSPACGYQIQRRTLVV